MQKRYEDLRFTDDFLFCKILMDNTELCKELTELILGRKINRIVSPMSQKPIKMTDDGRGVRLDVYFEDDLNTVYDIEMQTTHKPDLAKRARYYQGMIDLDSLKKGRPFGELKDSYIVFLCTFDPFGKRRHRYSFYSTCKEEPSLTLADGMTKVFISTEGKDDDISSDLKAFLNYLKGFRAETDFTKKIDQAVLDAQEDPIWRKEYMMISMKFQEERAEGRAEGREEGREEEMDRTMLLLQKMVREGRSNELQDFLANRETWEKAFEEFGVDYGEDRLVKA